MAVQSMEPEWHRQEVAERKEGVLAVQPPPIPPRPASLSRSPVRGASAAAPILVDDDMEPGSTSARRPSLAVAISEDPFAGLDLSGPSPHFATATATAGTRRR